MKETRFAVGRQRGGRGKAGAGPDMVGAIANHFNRNGQTGLNEGLLDEIRRHHDQIEVAVETLDHISRDLQSSQAKFT